MKIVIAGGSGFLGLPLSRSLTADGCEVVVLTRKMRADMGRARFVSWTPDGQSGPWADELAGAAAVINLAGESIAARRWSSAQKGRILQSRLLATRSLVTAVARASPPPGAFVSGSA